MIIQLILSAAGGLFLGVFMTRFLGNLIIPRAMAFKVLLTVSCPFLAGLVYQELQSVLVLLVGLLFTAIVAMPEAMQAWLLEEPAGQCYAAQKECLLSNPKVLNVSCGVLGSFVAVLIAAAGKGLVISLAVAAVSPLVGIAILFSFEMTFRACVCLFLKLCSALVRYFSAVVQLFGNLGDHLSNLVVRRDA